MATAAELRASYDAVRAARLRGVRNVQIGDRSVTYSSDAEMRQVEADLLRDLSAATTTTINRPKQTLLVGAKGL